MLEQDYYQSNYVFLNEILSADLRQIQANINRAKELNKDGIDENLSKKYIHFANINKDARSEIADFIASGLQAFVKEHRQIDYCGRKDDEGLIMMFRCKYSYGVFSRYYDPDYDFSTETKVRGLNLSILEAEEIIRNTIEMRRDNPNEYYNKMEEIISEHKLLTFNSALIEAHNVLRRRADIFNTLIDLYSSEKWIPFVALATLQVEGLFYDCCEILKEKELGGTAGTLTEKVDKAFKDNSALMRYAHPYFKYDVPLLRNTIAHVGTVENTPEELKRMCIDLILDINSIVSWIYNLSRGKYTTIEMLYSDVKDSDKMVESLIVSMLSCMSVSDFKYLDVLVDTGKFEDEFKYMKFEDNFIIEHTSFLRKIIDTEEFWNYLACHIDENKKCEDKPYCIEWLAGKLADAFIKIYSKESAEKKACANVMSKVNICKKN